jgi:class I fructose-bisphosphate aldolase
MDYGKNLLKKGKGLFLAYDQGLEHGPTDFNDKNADPSYIMDIANKGGYTGVIFEKGVAQKYYSGEVPLIVKLNGKTKLVKGDPLSTQFCSVKEAIKLGAKGVGYTVYPGSQHENKMFKEFGKIVEEAHSEGIPVIAWMYPRGHGVNEYGGKELAYAARIGLELGADIIKMKYNNKPKDLKWCVKVAGRARIVIAGGKRKGDFLQMVDEVMRAGVAGVAVGRNVWQGDNPMKITKDIKKRVFG